MRISVLALAVLALGLTNVATAGDIAAGQQKSATCVACHGADGIGVQPIYPNLAGQQEEYLVSSAKAYRDGERNNDMMKMFVVNLSDADIEDLAAYYSSLK
jgi:cytochrome c553